MQKLFYDTPHNMNRVHDEIRKRIPELWELYQGSEAANEGTFTTSLIVHKTPRGIKFSFPNDDREIFKVRIGEAVKSFDTITLISRVRNLLRLNP